MAIDTRSKRASSVSAFLPWRMTSPLPDGSLTISDRYHISLSYGGITGTGAVVVRFCKVEYFDGTDWIDISTDVITSTLKWNGGIRGSGPTDRTATPGTCEFEIRNGTSNAGGVVGYYSPDHASLRTGWKLGAKIRITLFYIDHYLTWVYRTKTISPIAGLYRERKVEVTGVDYMEEFAKRKVSGLEIQTNARGDELLSALVNDTMPFLPGTQSFGTGEFVFPYAFHDEKDEETSCLTVLQKISQSELSYIYISPSSDPADEDTLVYEPHTQRQNNYTSFITLTDTMTGLSIEHTTDNIYNKIRATTYPVEIESDVSTLGEIAEEFSLEPGETKVIYVPYRDEGSEVRISGTDFVGADGTDLTASSAPGAHDGLMTAYVSGELFLGANTMRATVLNTHTTSKAYVDVLRIRGHAVRLFNKVESVAEDATSKNTYGEKTLTYNMPYQSSAAFGQSVGNEILRRYKDPLTQVSSVTFIASTATHELVTYATTVGISGRVTLTETVSGVNDPFYVNGFENEMLDINTMQVTWILERAFNDTHYFTLDSATYGVLDGAYPLAPF